ncbi:putative transcription elongation protein [Zalerion maritima]|uniref:Transcription elongation factor 1 homolog n=1 Tax=Zalerion maritima TaxID=339359 RepID=A0AAD5RPK7_9PEZI|nr:putative transcription elongation protein [Zalerion maritima]
MGKRKSSKKPQGPKKSDPLPSQFTCLFCNHEKSVQVKLDKKAGIGTLECKTCGQHFQSAIHYLSAAVDVYGDWVDAADAIAKEENGRATASSGRGYASKSRTHNEYEDDAEQGYEGDVIVGDDDFE